MAADTQTEPTAASSSSSRNSNQPGRKISSSGKRENVFTRKLGPLPMWVWVAIIGAAVVLYAVWKGRGSSSTSGSQAQKGAGAGGAFTPPTVIQGDEGQDDDDDEDRDATRKRKHGHGHRGKKGRHEGPEREWLEKKTGSEHPWTYLARHHERIEVGPHGSRIVHGGDPRRHRHRRDHDEATDNTATATRAVPGQSAGPPGVLQSMTTPAAGVTPSLAQVAAQFNTAPDAIVEEATGRGSPHGALWRRYVAAHDWQAPLPHGTDLTVLQQPA